jgi:arylsulfatase A-like enzyme
VSPRLVSGTVDDEGRFTPVRRTPAHRVIAPQTAAILTQMLAYVVEDGTGTSAQISGYQVAGKTGTALKPDPAGGYYPDRYPSLANILQNAGYASGEMKLGPDGLAPAADFVRGAGDNPFFLRVDCPAMKPPYQGIPQKNLDRYATSEFPTFIPPAPAAANAREGLGTPADPMPVLRRAAAAITALDEYVGKLLTELDKASPSGDTVVVFTSSCGALLGRHGLWGAGDASDPVNMYEEAVCTPMIWRWPKRLPPLTSRPELFSALDLVPAIIEATGAPPVQGLCGRSYLQVIAGKKLPKNQIWRNVVFAHYENADMVRDSRYKLVLRDGGTGPGELYDLQTDRLERINRYDDPGFLTVRAGLAKEIAQWRESCPARQK